MGNLGEPNSYSPWWLMMRCSTSVLSSSGKSGTSASLRLQHLELNDHVSEQLAARGVGKRTVVGKFVNLADVVKKNAGQQQVAVDLRIISAHQVAGTKQRDYVVEQAADIGVMQGLGGGSIAIRSSDLRIRHEGLYQSLEIRILKRSRQSRSGTARVRRCFWWSSEDSQRIRSPIRPAFAACGW